MKKKKHDFAENTETLPEVCAYAAQTIAPRIERMLGQTKAARNGNSPEAVHQIRVWSRRSRAALELFAPCLPGKKSAAVAQAVHDVTGAAGLARDLDVMLTAIKRRTASLPAEQRPELRAFALRLKAERKAAQQPMLDAINRLEKQGVMEWAQTLAGQEAIIPPQKTNKSGRKAGNAVALHETLTANAAALIGNRLDALLQYEDCLEDAGQVQQHHAMRIAAKKLRYTMDIFREAVAAKLPNAAPFDNAFEAVRRLQDNLGEMHDADVLAPKLAGLLADILRSGYGKPRKNKPVLGVHCVNFDACEGVLTLCRETAVRRDAQYVQLKNEWETLKTGGVFDALKAALHTAQNPAIIEIEWPETPILEVVAGGELTDPADAPVTLTAAENETQHEETRPQPIAADGNGPARRTVRKAPARAAANPRGRAESGADTVKGAPKSRVSHPAPTEKSEPE